MKKEEVVFLDSMNLNSEVLTQKSKLNLNQESRNFAEKNKNITQKDKAALKKAAQDFSSIFIKKMFDSMRDTLPEEKLIDGGYAEEVFTDMMDKKISKLGARGNSFSNLNNTLYQQLLRKQMVQNGK